MLQAYKDELDTGVRILGSTSDFKHFYSWISKENHL